MILVFELSWTGTVHAPGNSATTQIIARAWPEQRVVFHADPSHLAELGGDPALGALGNVELRPVVPSPLFAGQPHVVSARRAAREFAIIRKALAAAPRREGHLVVLISTTATTGFAAAWAARLSGRRAAVQVGYHGNLNDALGWRPRNPLARAFDTRSAVSAAYPVPLRALLLEEGIRDAMERAIPGSAARADVIPLPINAAEAVAEPPAVLGEPVRVGFVGLGTAAKGIDVFLRLARRLGDRHPGRLEFVHIGRVPGGQPGGQPDPEGLERLAHPPARSHLSRAEFAARMAGLHAVVLPYQRGYYDLSASGALVDALTWLTPVIATRVPLTQRLFEEHGEMGVLCDDEAGLERGVEDLLLRPDPARRAAWVANLRRARAARDPAALAERYRAVVQAGFPGLLDGPPIAKAGS